jgi:isopentenyldiphosphate isomerase
MSETINTYEISNPSVVIPADRKLFYKKQVELSELGKKPTHAVGVINVFLFNQHGDILLQKRSFDKNHNPGLIDKSIGGHITAGNDPDYTTMIETIQELQTPSLVLSNKQDFLKAFGVLKYYLETTAVLERIATKVLVLPKVIDGKKIDVANMSSIYFGVYNGRVRPVDREAKGILWYSLDELKDEIFRIPEMFTPDLHIYFREYEKEMRDFIKLIAMQKIEGAI